MRLLAGGPRKTFMKNRRNNPQAREPLRRRRNRRPKRLPSPKTLLIEEYRSLPVCRYLVSLREGDRRYFLHDRHAVPFVETGVVIDRLQRAVPDRAGNDSSPFLRIYVPLDRPDVVSSDVHVRIRHESGYEPDLRFENPSVAAPATLVPVPVKVHLFRNGSFPDEDFPVRFGRFRGPT